MVAGAQRRWKVEVVVEPPPPQRLLLSLTPGTGRKGAQRPEIPAAGADQPDVAALSAEILEFVTGHDIRCAVELWLVSDSTTT